MAPANVEPYFSTSGRWLPCAGMPAGCGFSGTGVGGGGGGGGGCEGDRIVAAETMSVEHAPVRTYGPDDPHLGLGMVVPSIILVGERL